MVVLRYCIGGWSTESGTLKYHLVDPYGTSMLNPNAKGYNDGWYTINQIDSMTALEEGKRYASDNTRKVNNFVIIGNGLNRNIK